MRIGVLRESNIYKDKRTPLTPNDAKQLLIQFPSLEVIIQPSDFRVFSNEAYQACGLKLNEDLSDCDILLGVKEVDINTVIQGKTYLFFAHIAKSQTENLNYLKQLIETKITLIDYEYLTNKEGLRTVAFGYWAGIAGVYYTAIAIAKRFNNVTLPAIDSFSEPNKLIQKLNNFSLPNLRFLISGTGNTSKGVVDTLSKMEVREVNPNQFITKTFNYPVYCQLSRKDYLQHKKHQNFNINEFIKTPSLYSSEFNTYTKKADVYFACHYWEKGYPNYIENEHLSDEESTLKIVSDISCDIKGPIACSIKESTHQNPIYDYNPFRQSIEKAFSSDKNIQVIAIGNLPNALPYEASVDFSKTISSILIPYLLNESKNDMIKNATILDKGKLSARFLYLYKFIKT